MGGSPRRSESDRFSVIYKRYVATGLYQSWAVKFVQICPQPDFAAARTFWLRRIVAWPSDVAHVLWRHKFAAIAVLFTAAALVVGLVWLARRPAGRWEGR